MIYYRVAFEVQDSLMINPAGSDLNSRFKEIHKKLDDLDLKWIQDYYWPGSGYHCIVQVQEKEDLEVLKKRGLDAFKFTRLKTTQKLLGKRTVRRVFEQKYPVLEKQA